MKGRLLLFVKWWLLALNVFSFAPLGPEPDFGFRDDPIFVSSFGGDGASFIYF